MEFLNDISLNYYHISKKDKILRGTIHLPYSKSESNRVLIIRALSKPFKILNLSEAQDSTILNAILNSALQPANAKGQITCNAGAGGTTLRFLTSYFSIQKGKEVILTGSTRMKKRPIKVLVDALNALGAEIEYLQKPGFPPLKIIGKDLKGGKISIDGSISSQYISALLMIGPLLKNGIHLEFQEEIISRPYVDMTLKIMKHFGIKYSRKKNSIQLKKQKYSPKEFAVESDWSAASYWYEMAAFADEVDLFLTGLKKNSLQGDSVIAKLFEPLGIKTTYFKDGVHLKKLKRMQVQKLSNINFSNCPDLAQTLALTCAGLGISSTLSGLKTLRIKETDRILALKSELRKIGVQAEIRKDDLLIKKSKLKRSRLKISTYNDHRMAMAFAPLAMLSGEIKIEDPEVVKKSYPGFWKDLGGVGFEVVRN